MNEELELCRWCPEPCDRMVVDPYGAEIDGVEEIVPLHEECERELALQI